MIYNGKGGMGKQSLVKEYMIVPKVPLAADYEQIMFDAGAVYQRLLRNLQTKMGVFSFFSKL